MAAIVKREPINTRSGRSRAAQYNTTASSSITENSGPSKTRPTSKLPPPRPCNRDNRHNNAEFESDVVNRRLLRSRYLLVKNRISDERDDMSKVDLDKFKDMIEQVDSLHEQVQKPREQVVDAEALLDITSTLVTSVKAHSDEGVTPSDLVNCLLRDFGRQGGPSNSSDQDTNSVRWKDIGFAVSQVFRSASGCSTMVGPMDTELRQRRPIVHKKRVRPDQSAQPEELNESVGEEKTDTDKNMATMFNILRKNRRARLENLILNRNSFAQTVENLFALSFLVKDGRAEITVDEKSNHFVAPRNAPAADKVLSGDVSYRHFVFRFDFRDWKLMLASVKVGEELMPHRDEGKDLNNSQPESGQEESASQLPRTPIRKLSRNRGRVLQEETVAEASPETDDSAAVTTIRKGKRKLR